MFLIGIDFEMWWGDWCMIRKGELYGYKNFNLDVLKFMLWFLRLCGEGFGVFGLVWIIFSW